jgi:glycogen(starch) synthase
VAPLNVLVLTNLYPPYVIGGYEIGCFDLVQELRARGHLVRVVTSDYGTRAGTAEAEGVHRALTFTRPDHSPRARWNLASRRREVRVLAHLMKGLKPELVCIFNTWALERSLLVHLQRSPVPVVFAISDYSLQGLGKDPWMALWNRRASTPLRRAAKLVAGVAVTSFGIPLPASGERLPVDRAFFTSRALQLSYEQAGYRPADARVIHWGLPLSVFPPGGERTGPPRRLLFVGQLRHDKGPHVAIEAMAELVRRGHRDVTLAIVGGSQDARYVEGLKADVIRQGLAECVSFAGPVGRDRMPAVYARADILMFPSLWPEPFAITLLEAMGSGLAVVGTGTGGSAELLEHGVNSLVVKAGDSLELADGVERLLKDTPLFDRLRQAGQRLTRERYSMASMAVAVEAMLEAAVGNRSAVS